MSSGDNPRSSAAPPEPPGSGIAPPDDAHPIAAAYRTLSRVLSELFWLAAEARTAGRPAGLIERINSITRPWEEAERRVRAGCAGLGIPFTTFDPLLTHGLRKLRDLVQVAGGNDRQPFSGFDFEHADIRERMRQLADSIPPLTPPALGPAVRVQSDSILLSPDPHVREYLEQLTRRMNPAVSAFERAERATPGSSRSETSKGDGTARVRLSIPLTTEEAFDALGAGLAFHAHNARDIRSNEQLLADAVFPPPGWNPLRWRALAKAVGAAEADADTEEGRERIVVAAMAAVNRGRLAGFAAAVPSDQPELRTGGQPQPVRAGERTRALALVKPQSDVQKRRGALYERIRALKRDGMTEAGINAHLDKPAGRDLLAEVRWELNQRPNTKSKPRRARVPADVIAAALANEFRGK